MKVEKKEVVIPMCKEIGKLNKCIEQLRKHKDVDKIPERVWNVIEDVDRWMISTKETQLEILRGFKTDNEELQRLLNKICDMVEVIRDIRKFSIKVAKHTEEQVTSGAWCTEFYNGKIVRTYAKWLKKRGKYRLVVTSDDEYVYAEILTLSRNDLDIINIDEVIYDAIVWYARIGE